VSDHDRLVAVLRGTSPVLLDFDGPVTGLLRDGRNVRLAAAARGRLLEVAARVPATIAGTTDHLAVLRHAAAHEPAALERVERACDEGELAAAEVCRPTPGIGAVLEACRSAGRPVVVVSNNAGPAIGRVLRRLRLDGYVTATVGRTPGRPDLLKPHPHIVRAAHELLRAEPDRCVLIGDQVSDVAVARLTGVRSIGYARTTRREAELVRAGADVVVSALRPVAGAVRDASPPH